MAKSKKAVVESTVVEAAVVDTAVVETPVEAVVEPVQLTIADLQLIARIVDLASRRGAFQAGEMSQVGVTFDKLSAFLTYVEASQVKEEAPAAETAEA